MVFFAEMQDLLTDLLLINFILNLIVATIQLHCFLFLIVLLIFLGAGSYDDIDFKKSFKCILLRIIFIFEVQNDLFIDPDLLFVFIRYLVNLDGFVSIKFQNAHIFEVLNVSIVNTTSEVIFQELFDYLLLFLGPFDVDH